MTRRHTQAAWSSLTRSLRATPDNPTPIAWPAVILTAGVVVLLAVVLATVTYHLLNAFGGN